MPETIPFQCQHVANEIDVLEDELAGLQQEKDNAPPSQQAYYRREIRKVLAGLGLKRQQLLACLRHNPPPRRADLVIEQFVPYVDHVRRKLGIAVRIRNKGRGNARGPFRIDLAVTVPGASIVHVFEVPAGVTLFAEPVIAQSNAARVAADADGISSEYVTEKMELNLHYRDEEPSYVYYLAGLVDVEQVVSESAEGNNYREETWWFTSPGAILKDTPFITETFETA